MESAAAWALAQLIFLLHMKANEGADESFVRQEPYLHPCVGYKVALEEGSNHNNSQVEQARTDYRMEN